MFKRKYRIRTVYCAKRYDEYVFNYVAEYKEWYDLWWFPIIDNGYRENYTTAENAEYLIKSDIQWNA